MITRLFVVQNMAGCVKMVSLRPSCGYSLKTVQEGGGATFIFRTIVQGTRDDRSAPRNIYI